MDRFEMMLALSKDKMLKAIDSDGNKAYVYNNVIIWCDNKLPIKAYIEDDETWTIIKPEPKLKEFTTIEMLLHYVDKKNKCLSPFAYKSSVTHVSMLNRGRTINFTKEELLGMWTIDKYYREEKDI